MTDLTPTSSLDPVPQLETSTLALAGPGQPMNFQAQALLNRTQYLVEALQDIYNELDPALGGKLVGFSQFGLSLPGDPSPVEKGFWNNIGSGANIWKARDRYLFGDAVDQDGNKTPTERTWVGQSANGFMTYFDSRTQVASFSSIGAVAAAFASRSSDNVQIGERNTIGAGSFVDNNNANADDKKSVWSFYGHAVHSNDNHFTCCMEVDIANRQPTVTTTPYSMGSDGTTAGHWIGTGGETSQSGQSVNPASLAIGIVSTGTRDAIAGTGALFDKGIVFQSNALTGCDGATGIATAIEMARGHKINWLTPTNGYAAQVRSENAITANATSIVFANGGMTVRGLKPDLVTEQNLFAVAAAPSAVNYFQAEASIAGSPVLMRATGTDTNIDMALFPKGSGVLRLGYSVAPASVPANFVAAQMLAFKDASGSVYYIPCRGATW